MLPFSPSLRPGWPPSEVTNQVKNQTREEFLLSFFFFFSMWRQSRRSFKQRNSKEKRKTEIATTKNQRWTRFLKAKRQRNRIKSSMSIDTAVDTTCWYYWRVHWHLMKRWVNLKLNDWTTERLNDWTTERLTNFPESLKESWRCIMKSFSIGIIAYGFFFVLLPFCSFPVLFFISLFLETKRWRERALATTYCPLV